MGAIDDFHEMIESTEAMKEAIKNLREQPGYLLAIISREYETTRKPVPDYRIHVYGYAGEVALRALISAGLIKRQPGGMLAVYVYEPTVEGLAQNEKLRADDKSHLDVESRKAI